MTLRTCSVCGFSAKMDETDSLGRVHSRCTSCGLLFGDGHLAVDTDGLCQYCVEEETGNVDLDAEDEELEKESRG